MTISAIELFCDTLIPGNGMFPPASEAITDLASVLEAADRRWLGIQATTLASLAATARVTAIEALEIDEPTPFRRVLLALYGAYYAAPSVHAVIHALAESGPREPSTTFDPALLRQVTETQAGLRRL